MYFLVVNRAKPDADSKAIAEVIPAHTSWVARKIAAGKIVQAGKWGETGGIVIIRAADAREAQTLIDEDPIARSDLFTIETGRFYPDVESARFD